MANERVLIIGGDSKVGKELRHVLEQEGNDVWVTSKRRPTTENEMSYYLDLWNLQNIDIIKDLEWHTIYCVAAITGIMACHGSSEAWRVNADAPAQLALFASNLPSPPRFIFVSSDAVEQATQFSYSLQKMYAETVVLSTGGIVFRPGRIKEEDLPLVANALANLGPSSSSYPKTRLVRWP